jgi:hypothetical protein
MSADIVGSKMKDFPVIQKASRDNTKTGYGQNGYSGASSDTDPVNNPTQSALAVDIYRGTDADTAKDEGKKFQKRDIADQNGPAAKSAPVPDHPFMKQQIRPDWKL